MISSYVFRVKSADTLPAGRAYAFYSCLLSLLPADYVEALHAQGETPISQYLCREDGETFWQIHLLDQIADETVSPVLDELNAMPLHTGELELERTQRERFPAEELIQAAGRMEAERFFSLRFLSPVAFKRAGRYVVLPDKELLLQSVINKWNAWLKLGTLASEMESAALFIVASALHVRVGTVLLAIANQERAKAGLDNEQVHDTEGAIDTAIEAIRILIARDDA